jgi:hypothetical protein
MEDAPDAKQQKARRGGYIAAGFFRSLTSGRFLPETPPGGCCVETLRFPSASE